MQGCDSLTPPDGAGPGVAQVSELHSCTAALGWSRRMAAVSQRAAAAVLLCCGRPAFRPPDLVPRALPSPLLHRGGQVIDRLHELGLSYSEQQAAAIFVQVAEAVAHLHEYRVLHRSGAFTHGKCGGGRQGGAAAAAPAGGHAGLLLSA